MENVPLPVIGVVRTGYAEREATPIQTALNRAGHGTIEIDDAYAEGLDGLDGFDYAWLLTWLHRPDRPEDPVPLRQVPFLLRSQQRRMGIFATRGPRRVNPIGLSLIQILEVAGPVVRFAGGRSQALRQPLRPAGRGSAVRLVRSDPDRRGRHAPAAGPLRAAALTVAGGNPPGEDGR
jgi:tRNA-Thr(GGU) m(6)t(6)A37 methyltransferase TsaA